MTCLAEEMGEIAREINHLYGPKIKKPDETLKNLEGEMGDLLYSLACIANIHGINLDNALRTTMMKYESRDDGRWEKVPNYSLRHWRLEHIIQLEDARNYADLGKIAIDVVKGMPQPIGQVCGPISTGGYNSIKENLEYFNKMIERLNGQGHIIFNQMPFEVPMQELRMASQMTREETNRMLLESFYLPLFESGLIKKLYFICGWESSQGSKWEREKAKS